MYEASLMFLDDKLETVLLEDTQKDAFIEMIVAGKAFVDKKNDVVFWLPPGNLRLMTIVPRHKQQESQPCQKSHHSDPENDSKR